MRLLVAAAALLLLASCQSVDGPTVAVTGSAAVEAIPDIVSFTVSASYVGATTEEALSVSSGMLSHAESILTKGFGVQIEDIRTESLSVSPNVVYDADGSHVDGQRAMQSIRVTLRDAESAGEAIAQLSEIDGIGISGIEAGLSNRSAAEMKARELAVHDAVERASVYASAAGYILGDLISISSAQGASGMLPKAYSLYETAGTAYHSGVIEVVDEVSVVFSLVE